jgi:hypothetical protein
MTGGDRLTSLTGAVHLIDVEKCNLLVGTGYSSEIPAAASFASVHHVPMISPGSTSVEYADKTLYPYLLRTVASDKLQFDAFVQVALSFGWRKLAGLVQQSAYGLSQLGELEASVSRGGLVLWGQILVKMGRCDSFAKCRRAHYTTSAPRCSSQPLCALCSPVDRASAMDQLARSGCRVIMAVLATEHYQPLLNSAREKDMTERYVWITLDTAKGALASDGVLVLSRQPGTVSVTLKAFLDSWKADTTIYNKTLHGAFNTTTKRPLFDPNGPFWDTDYADVGDGVPDEWGMYVFDTVFLVAAALQSMLTQMHNVNDGSRLLQTLKLARIDGVSGELMLDPQTADRAYLFDLLSLKCNQSSVGCTNLETVAVMSQNATSKSFFQVADIRWPTGFGSVLPDDGSLLEPSKCTLIIQSSTFEASQTLDLRIDVADNFGEALRKTAHLILSVTKSSTFAVSTTEIMVPENSTTIAFPYALPDDPGAYEVTAFDKRTGCHIRNSPATIVVAGPCYFLSPSVPVLGNSLLVADIVRLNSRQHVRFGRGLWVARNVAIGIRCKEGEHVQANDGRLSCASCKAGYFSKGSSAESCSACSPGTVLLCRSGV